jgi:hypothetical protein
VLKIMEFQQKRIRRHIESVVRYLVRALLKPDSSTPLMPDYDIAGESDSNYFYVLTTIWYVTKYFQDWDWEWKDSIKWDKKESLLYRRRNQLPPDNWTFGTTDKDKIPLLEWYHYGSFLNLCQQNILPDTWKDDSLEWKVFRLAKVAKIAAAAKLTSSRPYTADDEIFDRLCFLSEELDLEHREHNIGTVASLAIKRIKQRDDTRELNPGWLPRLQDGSKSGPWEIHALCHHSSLVVTTLEKKDLQDLRARENLMEEAESYKQNIYRFLNAEGTLMPCWERAYEKARKGWLRSESTAVLASTLLDIHAKEKEREDESSPGRRQHFFLEMESLMKYQLDIFGKFTDEAGRLPLIKWTTFCPPRQYHPDSFFDSLEDTPDLYRPPKIQKACIPASLYIYHHATHPEKMEPITKDNLDIIVIPNRFFISDITASALAQQDDKGFVGKVVHRRYDVEDEEKKRKLVWALYDSVGKIHAAPGSFIVHLYSMLTLSSSLQTKKYSIDSCKSTIPSIFYLRDLADSLKQHSAKSEHTAKPDATTLQGSTARTEPTST